MQTRVGFKFVFDSSKNLTPRVLHALRVNLGIVQSRKNRIAFFPAVPGVVPARRIC